MIYKIDLKTEKAINYTNVLIEATDKKEALSIFKKQRVHESGISKKDYIAVQYLDLSE
jgi:hypothetical protein